MSSVRQPSRVIVLTAALLRASASGGGLLAQKPAPPPRAYDGKTRMLHVTTTDRAMNAAMERARQTAPRFVERLRNPPAGQTYVGVKVRVSAGQYREYLWLYDVRYVNGRIVGRSIDDGVYVRTIHHGDTLAAAPGEIADWMTVENGRACGGFTSRVMLTAMTPAQRAAYYRDMEIQRMPPGDAVCDDGDRSSPSRRPIDSNG